MTLYGRRGSGFSGSDGAIADGAIVADALEDAARSGGDSFEHATANITAPAALIREALIGAWS